MCTTDEECSDYTYMDVVSPKQKKRLEKSRYRHDILAETSTFSSDI
jgi:hypothetical protein